MRVADLSITKTVDLTTALPGDSLTYTIVVGNAGPSDITGATVTDIVPGDLTGATWTCTPLLGGACGVAGPVGGDISTTVDLAVGGSVSFTLTGTVAATATGTIVNSADVVSPAGAVDPDPADNTASVATTINPKADLSITKTDGNTTDVAGTSIQYSVVVTNNGPSAIQNAPVVDTMPAALSAVSWTCTPSAFSTCDATVGTGHINTTVDLLPGGTATFVVDATIDPAFVGVLSNTASVTMPGPGVDPTPANNSATDVTTIVAQADLSVSKTDGSLAATPGGSTVYTVTVTNAGPSAVTGASVSDALPAGATAFDWTCTASPGSTCTATGSGAVADSISLLPGGQATYLVNVTISSAATGTLVNTASVAAPGGVTDPVPGNNSATDIDTLNPRSDLSITKTDGALDAVPGTPLTYTVVVSNAGPSDAVGATVTDLLPAALVGPSWTCVGAGGGICTAAGAGSVLDLVTLPAGATVTYTVTATINASATGTLVNTATVEVPVGTTDPDPTDNSATDTDTLTPRADLSITKTDGQVDVVPGTPVTYTVVASNVGPSAVAGATVTDLLSPDLLSATWTCAAIGGSCPPSGSGDIVANIDLSVGGAATFTISATVSPSAVSTLANTVTIDAPGTVVDPVAGNNTATDTDNLSPTTDLSITKTDGLTSAQPGDPITYTIVVGSAGPSAVTGAVVTDTMPPGLTGIGWTCAASGGGVCAAAGSGSLDELVDLPVGASVTFTVTATVAATAGTITNTAQVDVPAGATDPNSANNAATDITQVDPIGDLSITKTDGLTSAVPGAVTSYTIDVTNSGPSAAAGVGVDDVMPASLTGVTWSCTATAGSACGNAAGVGDIAELVGIAAGGTVSFVVTATIAADASGTVANTATVSAPAGFGDTNPANDSATDVTSLAPAVDLAVSKTDSQPSAVPGTPITYTIVVTNAGPSAATGSRVIDGLPAALSGATWTCAATPGSSCGASSGTNSIDQIVTVGVGGTVTYIVSASVSPSATGLLVNTATVTPAAGTADTNPANDSATDTDLLTPQVNLAIAKTDGALSAVPGTPITYSIVVANAGPSEVTGATVADALPATLTNAAWTCTGTAGGVCGEAAGTGALTTTVTLPPGATVTYTLTADIAAGASGTLTNTATVSAPVGVFDTNPADNSSTDTDTLTPSVDLSITKTDGVASVVPGTSTTYTITVANSGPSTVVGADVDDVMPAEIATANWLCTGAGGATCGTASGSGDVSLLGSLPAGGSITIVVVADVDPAALGFVVNSATVVPPAGVVDTNAANNVATDSDALTPVADLAITKDDGLVSALPGDPVSYNVVVTNNGPSAVVGASVTDVMPAGLTTVTWACAAGPGSACSVASGAGDIFATVDLAVGESAVFTIDATIAANQLGTVTNTAAVAAPPGVIDPNSTDNVATDTTTVNGLGDVSITKTDGVSTIVAGTSTTYTIVVTNPGPSQIDGIHVVDALPAGLVGATWSCASTGSAACGSVTGSGSIDEFVDMPATTTVTFTVTAGVAAGAAGTLSNTASVTLPTGVVDSDLTNNVATDLTDIDRVADLRVTKTDNVVSVTPGQPVSYAITVVNDGPSAVTAASLTDAVPAVISGVTWVCAPSPGAACGTVSGTGSVVLDLDLPVGASAVVTVNGTVAPNATGTLVNTATVTPPAGVTDPDGADNTATDTDTLSPVADVSVAKSNGVTSQSPGSTSAYTITVANAGPSAATGVTITDPLPAGVTTASWTCSAAPGSSCAAASGSGAISTTVDLAAGGIVTFTVSLQAGASAGTLTNTVSATVAAGTIDPDPSNNVASDTDTLVFTADLAVTKVASTVTVAGRPVVQLYGRRHRQRPRPGQRRECSRHHARRSRQHHLGLFGNPGLVVPRQRHRRHQHDHRSGGGWIGDLHRHHNGHFLGREPHRQHGDCDGRTGHHRSESGEQQRQRQRGGRCHLVALGAEDRQRLVGRPG